MVVAEGEELASNLLLVVQSSLGDSNADPGFGKRSRRRRSLAVDTLWDAARCPTVKSGRNCTGPKAAEQTEKRRQDHPAPPATARRGAALINRIGKPAWR